MDTLQLTVLFRSQIRSPRCCVFPVPLLKLCMCVCVWRLPFRPLGHLGPGRGGAAPGGSDPCPALPHRPPSPRGRRPLPQAAAAPARPAHPQQPALRQTAGLPHWPLSGPLPHNAPSHTHTHTHTHMDTGVAHLHSWYIYAWPIVLDSSSVPLELLGRRRDRRRGGKRWIYGGSSE